MNMKTETMGSLDESPASQLNGNHSSMGHLVTAALAVWFGLVLLLGIEGRFAVPPGSPPLPIFFGFAVPLALFFSAYLGWSAFRAFILGIDLRFVAAIQGWRWAGLGFLSLYAYHVLPALFAFPAGLGDMAVGFTAPWIVLGLVRDRSFATGRRFAIWNILGITDLVVAVSLGALSSGILPGLTGNITASPMAKLPLVFIPAYLVPFFIALHFTALSQARQLARSGNPAPTPKI